MTDNVEIGKKLFDRRTELRLTLQEVADSIGVASSTIQRYESGNVAKIKLPVIDAISKRLGINPAWVCGKSEDKFDTIPLNAIPLSSTSQIPVVGKIAAGIPVLAEENIIGYEYIPDLKNPEEYFCLLVKGDSMINAGIFTGSKVLIHIQPCANDGQIVACMVNGDEATLKRFKQVRDTVVLMPENPSYQPVIVSCADFENGYARICGVAKKVITDL